MKNKIIIAAALAMLNGCNQTQVKPVNSTTMPSWINEKQTAPAKIVEKTPEEIARSKESDKAHKECTYEASKAIVGMSNSEGIAPEYFELNKMVAKQELEKQCLSVKGF